MCWIPLRKPVIGNSFTRFRVYTDERRNIPDIGAVLTESDLDLDWRYIHHQNSCHYDSYHPRKRFFPSVLIQPPCDSVGGYHCQGRKYHKKIWVYLTFILRLFSLNNPITEFIGLWQTRYVKRYNLFQTYYNYDKYPNYDSPIIKSNPLVSIILPTYNRYEALKNVLEDLQKQIYNHFEIIVIDQSKPFKEEFYKLFQHKLHLLRQDNPGLWKARNKGIKHAKSDYLLFLDDDSRVKPDWILEHLKGMDYFNADISSGVSISRIGAKLPENYSFFRWSDQLDTGNVLITKKVFEKCGLFDEQFENMRMGDGEFGVRSYLNGLKNISNPKASRQHIKISTGGLRDMGSWDGFRTKHFFQPKIRVLLMQ